MRYVDKFETKKLFIDIRTILFVVFAWLPMNKLLLYNLLKEAFY